MKMISTLSENHQSVIQHSVDTLSRSLDTAITDMTNKIIQSNNNLQHQANAHYTKNVEEIVQKMGNFSKTLNLTFRNMSSLSDEAVRYVGNSIKLASEKSIEAIQHSSSLNQNLFGGIKEIFRESANNVTIGMKGMSIDYESILLRNINITDIVSSVQGSARLISISHADQGEKLSKALAMLANDATISYEKHASDLIKRLETAILGSANATNNFKKEILAKELANNNINFVTLSSNIRNLSGSLESALHSISKSQSKILEANNLNLTNVIESFRETTRAISTQEHKSYQHYFTSFSAVFRKTFDDLRPVLFQGLMNVSQQINSSLSTNLDSLRVSLVGSSNALTDLKQKRFEMQLADNKENFGMLSRDILKLAESLKSTLKIFSVEQSKGLLNVSEKINISLSTNIDSLRVSLVGSSNASTDLKQKKFEMQLADNKENFSMLSRDILKLAESLKSTLKIFSVEQSKGLLNVSEKIDSSLSANIDNLRTSLVGSSNAFIDLRQEVFEKETTSNKDNVGVLSRDILRLTESLESTLQIVFTEQSKVLLDVTEKIDSSISTNIGNLRVSLDDGTSNIQSRLNSFNELTPQLASGLMNFSKSMDDSLNRNFNRLNSIINNEASMLKSGLNIFSNNSQMQLNTLEVMLRISDQAFSTAISDLTRTIDEKLSTIAAYQPVFDLSHGITRDAKEKFNNQERNVSS